MQPATCNTKILCTVTNDLSYDQRMIRICSSLAHAGYDVMLIGRKRSYSIPLSTQNFQQKRLSCFFDKGKFFYLEYNLRLFFFLLFSDFDIVCSVDLDTILPGLWISKLKGKICVYDAHEYFTEVPEVVNRPRVKKIWEWIAAYSIPRVHYRYTVNHSLAEIFEKKYGRIFNVIRNFPLSQRGKEKGKKRKKAILYQGVLNKGRGLEAAILAMKFVENAELWLAGEGDLSQALRELVKKNKLEHKVRFLGYVQPKELKDITNRAIIGLNLLESTSPSYYFSLANKALDYIQSGLPSLQMDFPEYRQIQEKYHPFLLMTNLDQKQIAQAIKQLLEGRILYTTLKINCLMAAKELNWEKEEQKLLKFYRDIQFSI